jgi:hypothetical protein
MTRRPIARAALAGCAALLHAAAARAAPPAPAPTQQTCVDVAVGTAQSYDCINQALAEDAAAAHRPSSATDAPYAATSPSNVTGQFNESATRNRLGAAFGHSVTPERPAAPIPLPTPLPR